MTQEVGLEEQVARLQSVVARMAKEIDRRDASLLREITSQRVGWAAERTPKGMGWRDVEELVESGLHPEVAAAQEEVEAGSL
jgi:hypothetical protein